MKTNNLTQGTFKSAARLGLLALLAAVAPAVSRASVGYTNFGTSPLFNTTQGNEIGPDGLGDDLAEADQFTAAATLNLSTIEIALSCVNTGLCPNSFAVALESDDAGSPANTVTPLASFTVTGSTLPILGSSIDQTLTYSGPTLTLDSGTSYWLVVLPDAAPVGADQIAWNLNSIGQTSSTNNTAKA